MGSFGQLLQFLMSGITAGSIYALAAIGFTVVYNCTQVVNFAQGEFVMLGAMIAAVLVTAAHLPLPLACVLAVALASGVGCLVAMSLLRPLRTGSPITMIIITVGASILIRGVAMLLWGKDAIPLPGFSGGEALRFAGASLPMQSLWVLGVTAVLVFLLWFFYQRTLLGRAMRACASCKSGAQLVGINPQRMTLLSFALGAAIGAAGGVVIAPITLAQYDMGTMLGLKGFCAAILGGMGSFAGGIIAGLILGVLEAMGAGFISSAYKDAIAFVVLLGILLARPEGVLGTRKSG
ncbi:MAG: branched-chain amino acid ABC transporter permease [Armatimonadota bacterium]|jgi:branched-chain amino acid transport system permease protein|nr:branched-chain amino acid ABC transporter permease [Armatimonadota bacterium]